MFKATEVEWTIRNKSTCRYANKSLFVQNFRLLFLAVYPVNVYIFLKFLQVKQIMAAERM